MILSEEQRAVVEHLSGPVLVKAGPGSGKTRVLIERVKRIIEEDDDNRVLALTFSNLAADEMQKRLDEDYKLGDSADHAVISTIHSFCLNLVEERGETIGLPNGLSLVESEDDKKKILREVLESTDGVPESVKNETNAVVSITDILKQISECKRSFSSLINCDDAWFPEIYERYNTKLLDLNLIDYDDILLFAHQILTESEYIRSLLIDFYTHICVDEAQDLNSPQYEVLKALCGEDFSNIMLVGDANQSIYGFNGSDSSIMTARFLADFKPTVFLLTKNYRSAKQIIKFADTLRDSHGSDDYYYDGMLTVAGYPDERTEAEKVISDITEYLRGGSPAVEEAISYNDIAVIARNRYALNEVEAQMGKADIPHYFKRSKSGISFESDTLKIFELSARLKTNSKDILHRNELISLLSASSSSWGGNTNDVDSLLANTKYEFLLHPLSRVGATPLDFDAVMYDLESEIKESDISQDEKYLILGDIALYKSHWLEYAQKTSASSRSFVSFRNAIALGKTQDTTKDAGVSMLTVHMSKGLQYKVVFIVGAAEGTFPDYRAVRAGGRAIEEERNEMYVAVTRAMRICEISFPKTKLMPWGTVVCQKPSEFISSALSQY